MSTEQLSPPAGLQVPADQADTDGPNEFDLEMDALASGNKPPVDDTAGEGAADPGIGQPQGDAPPADHPAGQDPAAGEQPPAGDQPTDIWANAPAELKEAHQAALRDADLRYNSVKGRLSTADRQLAELRAAQGQPAPAGGQEPGPAPAAQPASNPFETEAIKKLREDYGEVAGPLIDAMVAQAQAHADEINALKAPVQQMGQERFQAAVGEQESFLTSQHADWKSHVEDERFSGWVQSQPQMIRDAIARNASNIVDGREAAMVIGMFKAAIGAGTPPPPPPPPPPPNPQPSAIEQRRQRQLEAGRDGGQGNAAPASSGVPEDFDSAMDVFMARKAEA
ncbi:hypothetical protein KFK14_12920 [Sphingobium phenoxybenzoativorans]|uniref:Uncharacterized protein n=1 Tax=Sphingobium phenoxybenzoativorans TaxID=1592790 RepID=A0A975K350_9SPHN|nr:hypothetical protein [Sphingobium phenoxybenzoativorans]QUT04049.1 hypothetical protein KFK14_12920 [Sphingobium phenoxybenzoativorans]